MSKLRASTLNRIRKTVNKYLPETCDIESSVDGATGSMGQKLQSWETVATGVSCRVIRAGNRTSGDTAIQGGRETIEDTVRIILPVGTVVDVDYRIVIGNRSYQIVGIQDDLTDAVDVSVIGKRIR